MAVQGTDVLLIQRGGVLYKATAAEIAALGGDSQPEPHAIHSTGSSVTLSSGWVTLEFPEVVRSNANISKSANNRTFTVSQAGFYQVSGSISLSNVPQGSHKFVLGVYVNGVLVGYLARGFIALPSQDWWGASGINSIQAAIGDEIELRFFCALSGAYDIPFGQIQILKIA